jgi:hypothetical protein
MVAPGNERTPNRKGLDKGNLLRRINQANKRGSGTNVGNNMHATVVVVSKENETDDYLANTLWGIVICILQIRLKLVTHGVNPLHHS